MQMFASLRKRRAVETDTDLNDRFIQDLFDRDPSLVFYK